MRVNDATGTVLRLPRDGHVVAAADITPSRALVPVTTASPSRDRGHNTSQRSAAFVAQLLAAKAQLPQTRERRRAEPDVAANAYARTLYAKPYAAGRVFSSAS
jgi:hypothetical protein